MTGWWIDVSQVGVLIAPDGALASTGERLSPELAGVAGNACHEDLRDVVAGVEDIDDARVAGLIRRVGAGSPYLTGLLAREPDRFTGFVSQGPEVRFKAACDRLRASLDGVETLAAAQHALRFFKADVAALTALADIGGLWSLDQVTGALTLAADAAIQAALGVLFRVARERGDVCVEDDDCAGHGIFILAMGKYGAAELNYSSDIDIVVFFDPHKAGLRKGLDPQRFAVRIVRDLVALIQEQTADGYVFRVDLRLRPDPGSTQVAVSVDAGLIYYENYGQNWERAAFIKARPVAGDRVGAAAFLNELTPFIWRKHLDFSAVADVQAMKRQIHAVKGYATIAAAGHDIKLGRGGIREIEFFVQTQQLIAGGRQPQLRDPRTRGCLRLLAERRWIEAEVRDELDEAYIFLRTIEHRLQMVRDAQTHLVPEDVERLNSVALFAGFADADAFCTALTQRLRSVQRHYSALFEDVPGLASTGGNLVTVGEADDPQTLETLEKMGFRQPTSVLATLRGWHHGRYRAMQSERARERLTELQPLLVEAVARTGDPDSALASFDRFFADLPAGIQLFSLLRNNPNLLRLLADIMGSAPRLARILSRRSRTLEAVLDPGFFGSLPDRGTYRDMLSGELRAAASDSDGGDMSGVLDRARVFGQEQSFLIGTRVLAGTLACDQAGAAYSALADAVLETLWQSVGDAFAEAHGRIEGSSAGVVAMGKLGGGEMTASSDLDLILVYGGDERAESVGGTRPLSSRHYYTRLTQRLVAAVAAPTAEGVLYEVDLRLRPSGNSGPVASSLASFEQYQREQAWMWEHLALTRARVVTGPDEFRDVLGALIRDILTLPRERGKLVGDVRDMRVKLAQGRGSSGVWDLKLTRGGLVDIEFIAQFLQLAHAHDRPGILDTNTAAALGKLRDAGLLDAGQGGLLLEAARLYDALTQVLRLCVDGTFQPDSAPPGLRALLCQAVGEPGFDQLEARLGETQTAVLQIFDDIIR